MKRLLEIEQEIIASLQDFDSIQFDKDLINDKQEPPEYNLDDLKKIIEEYGGSEYKS